MADTQTTEAERMTRWIAEKVMGWEKGLNGIWWVRDGERVVGVVFWRPLSNPAQAARALDAWRKAGGEDITRLAHIGIGYSDPEYSVSLEEIRGDNDESIDDFTATVDLKEYGSFAADSLPLAICRALCAATGMPE